MAQNTSSAVMAQRREPADSLDFFPTPPWATRALCEFLDHCCRDTPLEHAACWEPACGQGDMVRPLREWFLGVHGSDVHDYGVPEQATVQDFLWPSKVPGVPGRGPDWIITNPPFRLAGLFALHALTRAREGVALLVRTSFLEGGGRYETLFAPHPPAWILQFCERVPMFTGRLDAKGSSATAYCWVVWRAPFDSGASPAFHWLPPCRKRLERPGDYPKAPAGEAAPAPLLERNG